MNRFQFNSEFQRKLIKLALIDDGFCTTSMRYVAEQMFESDSLRWCWRQMVRERQEKRTPTMLVLRDLVNRVEQVLQPRYRAMLDAIEADVLREDHYIRHALAEFVKRNLFVEAYNNSRHVYNVGKADEAIELMRQATEKIHTISFAAPARHWFYDDLDERNRRRQDIADREWEHTFPTGIVGVDQVLDGGLSRGELGVWIADSKGGKSVFLVHLAGFTCRSLQRRVLFILLEGSYLQTASRFDAWHASSMYSEVKRGEFDAQTWAMMRHEYHTLRQLLVIREFVDSWSYHAGDIRAELDDLKAQFGWVPDKIVCDYGDLLRSQSRAQSEEEHQRNAFGDLKAMTAQDAGYSIWTASQSRRPVKPYKPRKGADKEDAKAEPEREDDETFIKFGKPVLRGADIADSYNKIRRADFIGSINQDAEEKEKGMARLWCDRYRDNAAQRLVVIKQNLDKMLFADLTDQTNRVDSPDKVQRDIENQFKNKQKARLKAAQ
jgi:replicative DNA helicase